MWEIPPVKVGLDSSIGVVVAEVWYEYKGVHKGQCQTFRYTAEVNWLQWIVGALWEGPYREDGLAFIGGIVMVIWAGNV